MQLVNPLEVRSRYHPRFREWQAPGRAAGEEIVVGKTKTAILEALHAAPEHQATTEAFVRAAPWCTPSGVSTALHELAQAGAVVHLRRGRGTHTPGVWGLPGSTLTPEPEPDPPAPQGRRPGASTGRKHPWAASGATARRLDEAQAGPPPAEPAAPVADVDPRRRVSEELARLGQRLQASVQDLELKLDTLSKLAKLLDPSIAEVLVAIREDLVRIGGEEGAP